MTYIIGFPIKTSCNTCIGETNPKYCGSFSHQVELTSPLHAEPNGAPTHQKAYE